jgi:hypothetical protein
MVLEVRVMVLQSDGYQHRRDCLDSASPSGGDPCVGEHCNEHTVM